MTVPATPRRSSRAAALTVAALGGWVLLVIVAWRLGLEHRATWKLRAAPLAGFVDPHLGVGTLLALAMGLVGSVALPRWADRVAWRTLLVGTVVLAAAWGALLGVGRGFDGLDRGLAHRHEYPAVVAQVDAIGLDEFVDTFTDERVLRRYPIHVQGHPLGAALLFVGLDRIGLSGPAWSALVVSAVGATAAAAVLLAVREVAGERSARSLAPFLVLAPAAVWMVASADGLFAAVGAWSIALLVLATSPERSHRRATSMAVAAGLVAGLGINLSYGLVPVLLVGVVVAVWRRAWLLLGWAGLGGIAALAAAAAGGFWWFDGLAATRIRYVAGISSARERGYFTFVGNPAALAIATGPAVAVAIATVRDRRLWLLGGAALAAAAVANASGLSKAEVERIWLPFTTWILVLTAGLPALGSTPGSVAPSRSWPRWVSGLLALQVATAVAVESLVQTPW